MRSVSQSEFPQAGNKAGGLCPRGMSHFASCCIHTSGFSFQPMKEFSLSLKLYETRTFHPPTKALAVGFYLGLCRGVEENKWFSCDTEISRQDPDREGKIGDISVPFLLQ